jgi:hypothetical protein
VKEVVMRLLTLTLLALPAASMAEPAREAAQPAAPDAAAPICARGGIEWARGDAAPPAKAEVKRLGDLPSGALVLGVLRQENGCSRPVVIRYGYGAGEPVSVPQSTGRPGNR